MIKPLSMLFVLTSCASAGGILFDWTKNETAGHADWVADHQAPLPTPYPPSSESSWDGAYSTWAYTLWLHTGRRIRTLPPGETIRHGTGDSLDLAMFEVFILPEPQNPLSASEIQAVLDFLSQGGGVILIADHNSSDRDGDGWDSPNILNNAFEPYLGIHFHVTGDSYNSFSDTSSVVDPTHPVVQGPFGVVGSIAFHGATVLSIVGSGNDVQGVVWHPSQAVGSSSRMMVACGTYGTGRFCAMGDSSPADDGTGDPSDNLYDNWSEADNAALLMNTVFWVMNQSTSVAESTHRSKGQSTVIWGPLPPQRHSRVLDLTGREVQRIQRGRLYRLKTDRGWIWWVP